MITETFELVIKKDACKVCGFKLRPRDLVDIDARRASDVGSPLLIIEFVCVSCAPGGTGP